MSEMDKIFELMEEQKAAEASKEPAAETPAEVEVDLTEMDPLSKYIGTGAPLVGQSPFDAFLEGIEAEAPPEAHEYKKPYEEHDWKSVRATMFGSDHDVWRCQRCFRQVNVQRDETLAQALQKHNVHPDCSVQIAAEVMET